MPTVSIILQDAVDESAVIDLQLGNYIKGNDGPQGDKGDKGDTGDVTPAALAAQAAAEAAQAAAETAEANAAVSASAASTSEANAAASASSASTAATNAGNSATSSAISASNAATSETNAASSASSASTSASSASASASSASTSASTATTQASNASASASAAATSAANAATSETNAAASAASAAATSAQYATRSPNLIINPHGSIQQESPVAQVMPVGAAYFADQWFCSGVHSGGASQAQATAEAVSAYDPYLMYVKTNTAKATLAAGDYAIIAQPIEGNYFRRMLYGGASARGSWLRWRASSTQAGTASVFIRNGASNRSFVQSFAVTATPTDYSLFVPGDTTGTWPTDNTTASNVGFCFAAGATFQTATLGAWQAGNFFAANTQSNMLDTVNRQLNITDVQWIDSTVLLPFIPIDYEGEFGRCQRYVQKIGREGSGTFMGGATCTGTAVIGSLPLNTPMRTTPTWSGGTLQFFTPAGAVNATIAYDTNVNHVTLSASQTNTNGHSGYVISTATTGFRGLLARM